MVYDTVKLRQVAGSMVITITLPILKELGLKEGDRVLLCAKESAVLVTPAETKDLENL